MYLFCISGKQIVASIKVPTLVVIPFSLRQWLHEGAAFRSEKYCLRVCQPAGRQTQDGWLPTATCSSPASCKISVPGCLTADCPAQFCTQQLTGGRLQCCIQLISAVCSFIVLRGKYRSSLHVGSLIA